MLFCKFCFGHIQALKVTKIAFLLKDIEKDADRLGNDAVTFFDDVVRNAAGGGARFVLVDMEPPRGDTLAADKQAGRRLVPYFVDIRRAWYGLPS